MNAIDFVHFTMQSYIITLSFHLQIIKCVLWMILLVWHWKWSLQLILVAGVCNICPEVETWRLISEHRLHCGEMVLSPAVYINSIRAIRHAAILEHREPCKNLTVPCTVEIDTFSSYLNKWHSNAKLYFDLSCRSAKRNFHYPDNLPYDIIVVIVKLLNYNNKH